MKIEMIKIKRHWWLFTYKEVIFKITKNDGSIINQPMCNRWELTTDGRNYSIKVNYT